MAQQSLAEAVKERFPNKMARLTGGFYDIKDKTGTIVPFKANEDQVGYLEEAHPFNLILKARQKGMTTVIQLDFLDDCLFVPNLSVGVIAHTVDDAKKFFDNKVKFAYERLPERIRQLVPATQDRAESLQFGNGSSFRVGTSLRSDTIQRLHISEYGKLCAKYPEKAREVQTGALNTVQVGQKITIESTAEGEGGDFHKKSEAAQNLQKEGRELTALDFKFHFAPWFTTKEYRLEGDVVETTEMTEYFRKVEADAGVTLDRKQRNWYIKKREQQGHDMLREYPSTPDEAFKANVEGAYLREQMTKMREQGRICRIPILDAPVYTTWDLGLDDFTTITFWQDVGMERRAFDYEEHSGEGWGFYSKLLNEKGYNYDQHYMPHDADHRIFNQDATTRRHEAQKAGITRISVLDRIRTEAEGIDATRAFLANVYMDEERCERLIQCCDNYKKEWDEKRGTWKSKPLHNWASHGYKSLESAAIRPKPVAQRPLDLSNLTRGIA